MTLNVPHGTKSLQLSPPTLQKTGPQFGPGPASPVKPGSAASLDSKLRVVIRAPYEERKLLIAASLNARKVRTGRISRPPTLTPAQKKRLAREGIVLSQHTVATTARNQSASRFLSLPGELRNRIYEWCLAGTKQALVTHRPRVSTLRERTRSDRTRPLAIGDVDSDDNLATSTRVCLRPAVGLTQVCRGLRKEFLPLYEMAQEIGVDLTDVGKFVDTFFNTSALTPEQFDAKDWPFKANLTIALDDKLSEDEKKGLEILPFLDVWTNSEQIMAGFGCYIERVGPHRSEGEAKDM